jgi:hypothetical protein
MSLDCSWLSLCDRSPPLYQEVDHNEGRTQIPAVSLIVVSNRGQRRHCGLESR